MQTFEEYVSEWDRLVGQIEALKAQIKPLAATEMEMRKAIRDSVATAMGANYREGVNKFPMQDGRTLKVTNGIKREIDEASIAAALEAFGKLNDHTVAFDSLLRVKYELAKIEWNKLTDAEKAAVSVMIVAKPDTACVEIG